MVRLDDILEAIRAYNPKADLDLLRKAYVFSAKVHQGKMRLSGEPYLTHPMEVAHLLTELRMDVHTVVTGLLHDVLEDTLTTPEELRNTFGPEVADLVDGVTKISRITLRSNAERQAESFRKMLVAMARDLRVILVKLADRLHNMRTLHHQPQEEQRRIAQETLEIYAPLANRLGISWIKSDLEDLSLRYLQPKVYRDLASRVATRKKERETYIAEAKSRIGKLLAEQGITGSVSGRFKHLYSVYKKMERQKIEFDQVYDMIAFRILVGTVRECYEVLGIIHEAWRPIPGRFKDYIAMPKANGYQSLHTTVIGPSGERMEVQIRTVEMHEVAEGGVAAHWKYKEEAEGDRTGRREERQFGWLRQLMEWQRELQDSREFMQAVKVDLFPEEVYVFTPLGEVKELPREASPIDFAYAVHSDVGQRCVGARVNGKLVPLKSVLQNGDIVEIITSPNQKPSKDWLKYVRTSKARNKIRQFIKAEQREKSLELGREILDKDLRKHGSTLGRALGSEGMAQAVEELGHHGVDDLLAAIGYGKVTSGQVISRVLPREKGAEVHPPHGRPEKSVEKERKKPSSAIQIQGIDDIMVRFAKCCNPLPGDEVAGFITRGRGVTVHTADCPHVVEGDPERRIEVSWNARKKTTRPVKIRVHCLDQKGMLAAISGAITDCEANITSASVLSTPDRKGINNFEIDVQDLSHLNRVIHAVMKIKGVSRVERMKQQG